MIHNRLSLHEAHRSGKLRQAYVLLILGGIFLLVALLLHPDTHIYPLGAFLLGVGMLVAAFLYPYRLMIAGWLTTLLGLVTFLFFTGYIGTDVIFPVLILAIGLGVLAIALMGRRGYVGTGALSPGLMVAGFGILEYLVATGRTPAGLFPFMLSLWDPGIGLLSLGLVYLLMERKSIVIALKLYSFKKEELT
jgi:hypothetical protein